MSLQRVAFGIPGLVPVVGAALGIGALVRRGVRGSGHPGVATAKALDLHYPTSASRKEMWYSALLPRSLKLSCFCMEPGMKITALPAPSGV